MCLARKGAGEASGSHASPRRGWKERDTALFVNPAVLCVQAPFCHLSPVKCIRAFTKARSTSPAVPRAEPGWLSLESRVLQGRGGEYTWLQRLGVSIISAILQMLKVTRILYFPLLQDVLMNQCGKTTGLNLMVLYINTPYYITLALKTGSEQPSFECIEL